MADAAQEHLLNHLRDVHAVELHSARQLKRAASGPDEESRTVYSEHLEQTEDHEKRISELVESHGHSPSPEEDKTLRGGAVGIRQLADIPLDTAANVAMNLYALEHLEIAAYELLGEVARAADDQDSAKAAEEIVEDERQAAEKIASTFDRAAQLVLENEEDKEALLLAHLNEIHALEQQSQQLLRIACEEVCQDEELKRPYQEHLEQTEEHERLVNERIESHDAHPSAVKDLHFSTAKFGLHDVLKEPPDAQTKMAMNLFCVEHLEVAAYEILSRIAKDAGDNETAELAEKVLEEERQAAEDIAGGFARAVELMLENEANYKEGRAGEAPRSESREPEGATTN